MKQKYWIAIVGKRYVWEEVGDIELHRASALPQHAPTLYTEEEKQHLIDFFSSRRCKGRVPVFNSKNRTFRLKDVRWVEITMEVPI